MKQILLANLTETVLGLSILGVLLLTAASKGWARESVYTCAIVGLFAALVAIINLWGKGLEGIFMGTVMVRLDNFSLSIHLLLVIGAFLALMLSAEYLRDEGLQHRIGEYCALLLSACIGAMFLVSATDWVIIFLGLDTMSLALYALTGYASNRPYPTEAAVKYLLLGAMASGFLIYGIAFLYGAIGTTNLLTRFPNFQGSSALFAVGLCLVLIGLSFKIALVPFHQWAPDVYDGAITPIVAFMTTAPKVAAIAALFNIMQIGFNAPKQKTLWEGSLWLISVLTMTVGNLGALPQRNIKRMMAYSSIAHAGYMVMSVLALSEQAKSALLFYGLAYTLMTVGSFGILQLFEKRGGDPATLEELSGLSHRYPALGWAMVIFMASLTGIPFTAGFWAKFLVFKTAVEANFINLTIIAAINSVISAFYYLRVVVVMFAKPPTNQTRLIRHWKLVSLAVYLCALFVLLLGLAPTTISKVWFDTLPF